MKIRTSTKILGPRIPTGLIWYLRDLYKEEDEETDQKPDLTNLLLEKARKKQAAPKADLDIALRRSPSPIQMPSTSSGIKLKLGAGGVSSSITEPAAKRQKTEEVCSFIYHSDLLYPLRLPLRKLWRASFRKNANAVTPENRVLRLVLHLLLLHPLGQLQQAQVHWKLM